MNNRARIRYLPEPRLRSVTGNTIKARLTFVAALPLVIFCLVGVSMGDEEALKFSGTTMGPIRYNVTVVDGGNLDPDKTKTEIQSTLDQVNDLMSTYKSDSDISRFNDSQSTDWFAVAPETAQVIARSLEISEITKGAFDVTVGPAVNRWQFGPDKKDGFRLPDDAEIETLKSKIGYRFLEARNDPPAIKKSNPDVYVDLSAIAKGYAVDRVAAKLNDLGVSRYMIEVGGEVLTSGQRIGGGGWRIGIEWPSELIRTFKHVAEIHDMAMATSGDYRNYFEFEGNLFSHTIDPETCRPVDHGLATSCVVAGDCMTADALATAVMVLGPEKGMSVCEQLGAHLYTVSRDSGFGDELSESNTVGFPFAEQPNAESNPAGSKPIWPTFVGAAVIFLLAIVGMAVGAIFGNRPITGSCGGLSAMKNEDGESTCTICSKPTTDCVELEANSVRS